MHHATIATIATAGLELEIAFHYTPEAPATDWDPGECESLDIVAATLPDGTNLWPLIQKLGGEDEITEALLECGRTRRALSCAEVEEVEA